MPASDVPGEQASPTQPIPVKPPPFSAQFLDETNVTDIGAANRASVLAQLRKIRGGPAFNPPSRQGTVVVPGFHGGANWSGASFDPTTGLLYVNSNNVAEHHHARRIQGGRHSRDTGPIGPRATTSSSTTRATPAIKPPWGLLNAINLNTGEFAWRVPLGEHVELTARGIPRTGTETFGGSIVTAGGLVFIAGTKDERIHAFDKQTGRAPLGTPPPGRRLRDPFDLSGERPPVRRHRRRRRRQAADEGRAMRSWRSACKKKAGQTADQVPEFVSRSPPAWHAIARSVPGRLPCFSRPLRPRRTRPQRISRALRDIESTRGSD